MTSSVRLCIALSTRLAATLGSIFFSLFVARYGGADVLGQVTVFVSVLGVAVLVAMRGLNMMMMRDSALIIQTKGSRDALCYLINTVSRLWWSTAIAIVIGVVCLGSGLLMEVSSGSVVMFVLALPLYVLLSMLSGFLKGVDKAWLAPLYEIGGISLVATLLMWFFLPILGLTPYFSLLLSLIIVVMLALLVLTYLSRETPVVTPAESVVNERVASNVAGSGQFHFMVIGITTFLVQSGVFMLIAPFVDSSSLGLLRAVERLAVIVSFASLTINPFVAPRIVRLLKLGKHADLRRLMLKAMIAGAGIGAIPAVCLFTFPQQALALIGPDFSQAAPYLMPMIFFHYALVIFSPFSVLLNMGGEERVSMQIGLIVFVLALVLLPLGTKYFELAGAVGAIGLTMFVRLLLTLVLATHLLLWRTAKFGATSSCD